MQKILAQLQEKGVENIGEKISEKQAQYHYLLTEEAAARVVAIQNGVKLEKSSEQKITSLQNLQQGDRVTNVFKIHQFNEPKTFTYKERQGSLVAVNLKNSEAQCTLVLWNRDCNKFLESSYNVNDGLCITDAVVKNVNPLEIHSDLLTKIESAKAEEIPNRELKTAELAKLTPSEDAVSITAAVASGGSVKTFQKQGGPQGKILRLMLGSGETQVPLVCWGEYAELAKNITSGSEVVLVDVKAKINKLNNGVELHTTSTTRIVTSGKNNQVNQRAEQAKIKDLKENQTALVEGTIKELKEVKTIKLCEKCFTAVRTEQCQCGGKAQETVVAEAIIADNSGEITCTFFDSRALQFLEMKAVSPDIAPTVGELKKEAMKGKQIKLIVNAKHNHFLNQLKANCRQVL